MQATTFNEWGEDLKRAVMRAPICEWNYPLCGETFFAMYLLMRQRAGAAVQKKILERKPLAHASMHMMSKRERRTWWMHLDCKSSRRLHAPGALLVLGLACGSGGPDDGAGAGSGGLSPAAGAGGAGAGSAGQSGSSGAMSAGAGGVVTVAGNGGRAGGAAGAGGPSVGGAGASQGGAAGASAGGTAGHAGTSAAGSSGSSGSSGSGGGGGASSAECTRIATQYATELAVQVACSPSASNQCASRVEAAPGCDCLVPIQPKDPFAIENLLNIQSDWFGAGCGRGTCPASCVGGQRGTCRADASGGRCVSMQ